MKALIPGAEHIPFSVRASVDRAISDPGAIFPRIMTEDGMVETLSHWQARAAIEAMLRKAASSPAFAQAIEARRAETLGSVHESADVKDDAPIPNLYLYRRRELETR